MNGLFHEILSFLRASRDDLASISEEQGEQASRLALQLDRFLNVFSEHEWQRAILGYLVEKPPSARMGVYYRELEGKYENPSALEMEVFFHELVDREIIETQFTPGGTANLRLTVAGRRVCKGLGLVPLEEI